jgi:hypothetical protein
MTPAFIEGGTPSTTPLGCFTYYVHRPQIVRRSIWERLFEKPWRPLVATKVIEPPVKPDACVYVGGKLHCGGEFFDKLCASLAPAPVAARPKRAAGQRR